MYISNAYILFLVEVDEGEGKRDVERIVFVRICGSLARLKGDHQVNPSSRSLLLERLDELGSENLKQKLLKVLVHTLSKT